MSTETHEAEELQEKIARLLGWKPDHSGWWLAPDGSQGQPPQVAFDLGAALALCLDMARRQAWMVMVDEDGHAFFVEQEIVYDTHVVYAPVMDASSLALLALAALEDEAQP